MGAMLRFKQETGKEVTEIDSGSFTDLCTFLWCCVESACSAEKRKFDMSLMEFADSIGPEDLQKWAEVTAANNGQSNEGGEEKKRI